MKRGKSGSGAERLSLLPGARVRLARKRVPHSIISSVRTILVLLVFCGGLCFAESASITPIDTPAVEAEKSSSVATTSHASEIVLRALSMIGVKYKFGGATIEQGLDCSGFVRRVFAEAAAMALPRSSFEMSKLGADIDVSAIAPGDLVFFNTLNRPFSHVAIYLGDDRFVHAPSRGKQVEIVDMTDRYWKKRFNGARRLLAAK